MVVRVTGGPCMQTSCSAQVTPHSGLSCWNVIMDQLNVLKGLKSQAKELAYSLVTNEGWLKTLEQAYYLKNKASNSHTSWWTSGHIPGVTQVGMAVKTEFLTYPSQVEVEVRASCPRTHLEICNMIFTLPQMPCVNNLKFHKTVLELLQAFQKDYTCFKTFLLLLEKSSNKQPFKKITSLHRCEKLNLVQRSYNYHGLIWPLVPRGSARRYYHK